MMDEGLLSLTSFPMSRNPVGSEHRRSPRQEAGASFPLCGSLWRAEVGSTVVSQGL